jgi:RNA polymerase sigma factor (sigma-70 family)
MPLDPDDKILRDGCINGDKNAAERFVVTYSDAVYRGVQSTLRSRGVPHAVDDLKDIHNSVFLQIFEKNCRKLRQFKGTNNCSLKTWVRVITVRATLNFIRKRGYDGLADQRKAVDIDALQDLQDRGQSPLQHLEQVEQWRLLESAMQVLPPRDRLFMRLHLEKGLSVPEVASAMRLSVNNAHTVKHRVIARLRDHVRAATGEGY